MTPPRRDPSRLSPLGRPAWWVALGVLLVNDHLLKGAGIVPGWLTGKLSDFAFLVVAPVVLAALLPGRLPQRRALALISVVGVYTAADLSPAFSDGIVAAAARIGLRWRLWPDPTDLMALAILPLTVRLLDEPAAAAADVARLLRQRAGVILGAAACLATTESSSPAYPHAPFLLNGTSAEETIEITWVLRGLQLSHGACPTPQSLLETLNPADLDDPRPLSLNSGEQAALDAPPPPGVSPVGICAVASSSSWMPCVAAIVQAPSTPPIVMVARLPGQEASETSSDCASRRDPTKDAGPDALTLQMVDGQRRFVAGAGMAIGPIDPAAIAARPPSRDGCRTLRAQYVAGRPAASITCAVNTDCTVRVGPGIPGVEACGEYVRTGSTAALDELRRQWKLGCLFEDPWCPKTDQPAVCRNGTCGPVCPGVDLPDCPAYCQVDQAAGWRCDDRFGTCRLVDQSRCTCMQGTVVCRPADPSTAGCPLICLESPGGGSYPGDGGTP